MANIPPMRLVWQWRREILNGATVKDIAAGSGRGYSESTIRSYTKAERAKIREKRYRDKFERLLQEAHEAMKDPSYKSPYFYN